MFVVVLFVALFAYSIEFNVECFLFLDLLFAADLYKHRHCEVFLSAVVLRIIAACLTAPILTWRGKRQVQKIIIPTQSQHRVNKEYIQVSTTMSFLLESSASSSKRSVAYNTLPSYTGICQYCDAVTTFDSCKMCVTISIIHCILLVITRLV